jgi:hypothetical protein
VSTIPSRLVVQTLPILKTVFRTPAQCPGEEDEGEKEEDESCIECYTATTATKPSSYLPPPPPQTCIYPNCIVSSQTTIPCAEEACPQTPTVTEAATCQTACLERCEPQVETVSDYSSRRLNARFDFKLVLDRGFGIDFDFKARWGFKMLHYQNHGEYDRLCKFQPAMRDADCLPLSNTTVPCRNENCPSTPTVTMTPPSRSTCPGCRIETSTFTSVR